MLYMISINWKHIDIQNIKFIKTDTLQSGTYNKCGRCEYNIETKQAAFQYDD